LHVSGCISVSAARIEPHPIETHALETQLRGLVLGCLFGIAAADAPAITVDEGPGGPERRGFGALGDGVVEHPLDGFVLLLQALVEQSEMAERGGVGEGPATLWGRRRGRVGRDCGLQLVSRAKGE
jgi:hypothetical protein